ncbi:signal recognition particle-docking protein FtsY, partial [Mycolicibacterium elephantis]
AEPKPPAEPAPPAEPKPPAEPAPPAEPKPPAEPAAPVIEEIAPPEGRLERLRGRLAKSQSTLGRSMLGLLGGGDLDEDSWEAIEDTLLIADLGPVVTESIVTALRSRMAAARVRTEADARAVLREVLIEQLQPDLDRSIKALPHADKPSVLLVVGVNGTGKTTTVGKLARVLVADGRRVVLGAADTFRAAAADQLQTWASRVGAQVVRGPEGADPASVAFDAVDVGIESGADVVVIDTAGRLHTKTGLMDELGKVKRVVSRRAQVDEVLLVLDATVGQNGLPQARVFAEVVDITGVVLTKLDGTAKGGIVFRVQQELGVPVKLVGLGEGPDDLAPFEPAAFVDALLG